MSCRVAFAGRVQGELYGSIEKNDRPGAQVDLRGQNQGFLATTDLSSKFALTVPLKASSASWLHPWPEMLVRPFRELSTWLTKSRKTKMQCIQRNRRVQTISPLRGTFAQRSWAAGKVLEVLSVGQFVAETGVLFHR